jgi:hypothetical protein
MDLGDIIGSVGKLGKAGAELDPRKLLDLVNDLWGARRRIVEVVDFVWDNRDGLVAAIGFVQHHAEEVVDLAKQLPDLLGVAGEALETAGGGAKEAGSFLLGGGTQSVLDLAEEAAAALDRAHRELESIMGLFDRAGAELVALPVVGAAARPIVDGASRLGAVALDLSDVAGRMRTVGAAITDTGRGLDRVGGALTSSGSTLQKLRPSHADLAPARPRASGATKKGTAKKEPARKKAATTTKPTAPEKAGTAAARKKAPAPKR